MARKWWALLLPGPVLAAGGLFWMWQEATARLETELAHWSTARRAEGWQVAHAPSTRTGFPLSAALRVNGLRIAAPNGMGWQSERATLALFPQDHRQLRIDLTGAQTLHTPRGPTPVANESLVLRLRLDGQGGTLEGESLRIGDGFEARRLSASVFGTAIDLRADQLALPGAPRIDTLHLTGRATHPPGPTAAAWRALGGALNIERAEIRTGEVIAVLRATLTLDAALQPEGRGTLELSGVQEAVAGLTAAGLIPANVAPLLRTMMTLAARVPPEGGPPRVDVPLELRNRRITAARLPVGVMPALEWR